MCGMGIFLSNNIIFSGWRTKHNKTKKGRKKRKDGN
jgi:hypothetical protein